LWGVVAALIVGGCVWSNNSLRDSQGHATSPSPSYASPSRPSTTPQPALVAVQPPAHGAYSNLTDKEAVAPFKISTSSSGYYFVKLVDATTNQPAMVVFVHGGRSIEVNVPVGSYRMLYAAGTTWFGTEHYFGPETAYSQADTILKFYIEGNCYSGNEVTLYRVQNGNLRTSRISKDQF
jgi:hypothetical protein